MIEKSYYAKISKYYTKNAICSMAVEVKITKGNTLPFKCLAPHQEEFLLQAERTFSHKIPDVGRLRKPFDIMVIHHAASALIAIYYKPRYAEIFEIPIRKFLDEKYNSGKKSLTKQRASEIGARILI